MTSIGKALLYRGSRSVFLYHRIMHIDYDVRQMLNEISQSIDADFQIKGPDTR